MVTLKHPLMRRIQRSIFTYYGLRASAYVISVGHALEDLNVGRRYKLVRLLRCLLVDPPKEYLQSCSDDLMCRVWLSRWCHTAFWYSGTIYPTRNEYEITDKQKLPKRSRYPSYIDRDDLGRAARQLYSDGISTLHISSILGLTRFDVVGMCGVKV
jgi:hypothetical protein